MKILLMAILQFFSLTSFAADLRCTADFTNAHTQLSVTEFRRKVQNFATPQYWTSKIENTDFSFTVQTGLTRDIIDESEDDPVYVGKPSLKSLVIYNSNHSWISRFDVPYLDVLKTINLTVGSQAPKEEFRIHVVCQLTKTDETSNQAK